MNAIADHLQPIARELLAAWSRLPKHEFVPDRQDFDPAAVARLLPAVSIIERVDADEWRLRLIGTAIEHRWGRKLTGCDYLDLVSDSLKDLTRGEFRTVLEHPCGSWSLRHVQLHSGGFLTVETLRLPLRAIDGRVTLILSCSGKTSRELLAPADEACTIATIADQQFIDIGAGVPE
jgi:hypothetical protein